MFSARFLKSANIARTMVVRKMSAHSEEGAKLEVARWYKISIGKNYF